MITAFLFLTLLAAQGEVSSAYTELADCVETDGPAPINEVCEGYAGWRVFIGASDHSAGLAYSERARGEQLAQRPITGGLFQSFSSTVEWRVRRVSGAWTPFATIHRWNSVTPELDETGSPTGEFRTEAESLVVTALREAGPIGACHAAYVDVQGVYDANSVARAFADMMADDFRCGLDEPYRIGAGEAARLMELGRL
jgi:hypothetical protein